MEGGLGVVEQLEEGQGECHKLWRQLTQERQGQPGRPSHSERSHFIRCAGCVPRAACALTLQF